MNFNSQPPRLSAVQAKRGKAQKPQKRSCLSASVISSEDMILPDSAERYQRFIASFDKPVPHLRTHLYVADINRMRTPFTVFVICDVYAVYCGDSSNKHRRCCCCFTIYCSVEQSEIKGSVVFASAPVFYKELMNVSKLRCRMEPGRCAAVRSVCYFNTPPPLSHASYRKQCLMWKQLKAVASQQSIQMILAVDLLRTVNTCTHAKLNPQCEEL